MGRYVGGSLFDDPNEPPEDNGTVLSVTFLCFLIALVFALLKN
jgi:hypothetical protein